MAVDVDVKNASQRAGDEVVELYIRFPEGSGVAAAGAARLYANSSGGGRSCGM